jgi:hypothetical protein
VIERRKVGSSNEHPCGGEVVGSSGATRRERTRGSASTGRCGLHIDIVVTDDPARYKHMRRHDLPTRLELLDPLEVEDRLDIGVGEEPAVAVPEGVLSLLGDDAWWVPAQ